MNLYEIKIRGFDHPFAIKGETAGKAKYSAFLKLSACFDSFENYIKNIEKMSCMMKNVPEPDCSFENVCRYRDIPFARIGMEVMVNDRHGVICGSNSSANLDILFDGESSPRNCHPGWNMKFLREDGTYA